MEVFFLTEKMRCNNDLEFALTCDRVGEGKITRDDESFFLSRVVETDLENENENFKNGKLSIICTTNKYREEINREKLAKLLPTEKLYKCFSVDRSLNVTTTAALKKDIPYTQTGSLQAELHIKIGAPIVITANHRKREFKEDGILNGAR